MYELREYQESVVKACAAWIKYRAGVHGYVTSPGGSGKSIMIAKVAEFCYDSGFAVLILARSEKLLTQNKAKLSDNYQPHIGIYCAGLDEKDLSKPITIASIQSLAGADIMGALEGKRLICLVDECDEISPDSDDESQYWTLFNALGNPQIIGFTATPFRTKSGKINWGEEIINIPIKPLIDKKYLVPPTNKVGAAPDLSGVKVTLGEYAQGELEDIFLEPELLFNSIQKIKTYSQQRNSVLIFCQSLKHADILAHNMELNGMPCVTVDGKTDKDKLSAILGEFSHRKFKYLLNCNLLTVGYDMPSIDMIAVVRSTMSKRLWEQMLYRGTRLYEGKTDFLVLDMGSNFATHGALGSPYLEKGTKETKRAMGRVCPSCETFVPVTAKCCTDCGYEFLKEEPRKINHSYDVDMESEAVYSQPVTEYQVSEVIYRIHTNRKTQAKSLRVDYVCSGGYGIVSEWLSAWHENDWVRNKVATFFRQRGYTLGSDSNSYSEDDLLWHANNLKKPVRIVVDHSEKFPRVKDYIYEENGGSNHTAGVAKMVESVLGDDFIQF